ncbi:MAG: preprotein translocase subunit SecE [Phycisphaerae bacterium]
MANSSSSSVGKAGEVQPADARAGGSFFEVYKPGQGYYTRMCTAIGGGILVLGAGNFLFKQLEAMTTAEEQWTLWLQVGIPTAVVVGLGLLLFWLVGRKRGSCDFLIATEGEMKKVSWSTRGELIGSTKVVIAATVLLAVLLFGVDAMFIKFFQLIGVLRGGG